MAKNADETTIGEVKIELGEFEFATDQKNSLTTYFAAIQTEAEKAGMTVGQVVEKIAASLNRLRGKGKLSDSDAKYFAGIPLKFDEATGEDFLKWGLEGEISADTFKFFGKEKGVEELIKGLDIKNLNKLFARGMIDESQMTASDFFKKTLPKSTVEDLTGYYQQGDIDKSTYRTLANEQIDNSGDTETTKRLRRWQTRLQPSKAGLDFKKQWDEAAMSVARFAATCYALYAPFRKFEQFAETLRKANLQFANLAQSANLTASALASESGLAAASGSSSAAYANFRRSFELEMEKRNYGMGNGGQFTNALARFGIQYDPRDFDATMRNVIAFMSDESKSSRQRQLAGQMLGMDQGMISAAMRGQDFYDQYAKETKSLTVNHDRAAAASKELSLETQKLALAWQDFKDGIFADLQPLFSFVVQVTTAVAKILKFPVVRVLLEIGIGLFAFMKGMVMLRIAFNMGRIALVDFLAFMSKIVAAKTAEKAITTTTSIASAGANIAASAGAAAASRGIAGGIGGAIGRTSQKAAGFAQLGKAGAVLAVVDVISGVANTVMGGIQRHNTNSRLDQIYSLLTQRLPTDMSKFFVRPTSSGSSGSKTVSIENFTVRVEYLGKSHEELIDLVKDRVQEDIKSLVVS